MYTLFWILASTFLMGILSLAGVLSLKISEKVLNEFLLFMVALSAGSLMGGAFLHLMPEALSKSAPDTVLIYTLVGFVFFFFIEKLFCWHHCHGKKEHVHTFAFMNLLGDAVHNFIDGLVIASSFVANIPLGVATTLAIALHEIPQEIGDFGVLVYGGFKRTRALLLNFIVSLTAIIGGLVGYFLSMYAESSMTVLLPFAAGGFIYIAASDLVPIIRKEGNRRKSLVSSCIFIAGILLVYAVKFIELE